MRWAKTHLAHLGKPLWVVTDGAYAKAPFLKPVMTLGIVIVSRLRKDAALYDLPEPRTKAVVVGLASTVAIASRWLSWPNTAEELDNGDVRVVRQADDQDVQEFRGHMASGRRRDSGGVGTKQSARLGGLFQHRSRMRALRRFWV